MYTNKNSKKKIQIELLYETAIPLRGINLKVLKAGAQRDI
jgi:hypothetical protein